MSSIAVDSGRGTAGQHRAGAGLGRRERGGLVGRRARGVPAVRPCARPSPPAAPPRFAMVERGDAAPLLSWAEGPAVSPPQAPEPQAGGRGWGGSGSGRLAAEPWRRREPEELGASEVLLQPGRLELGDVEEDQVVAVFVVTFDPRSGERRSGTGGWERVGPPFGLGGGGRGGARCARIRTPAPHPHPAGRAPAERSECPREVWVRDAGLCSPRPPTVSPFRPTASQQIPVRAPVPTVVFVLLQYDGVLLMATRTLGFVFLLGQKRTPPAG